MSDVWWSGLAPVERPLRCGNGAHRMTWANGQLTAPDHPDAKRERALVALGADPVPCLEVLDSWHRHLDDLTVLTLASRGPTDRLDADPDGPHGHAGRGAMGWYANAPTHGVSITTSRASTGWWSAPPHPGRQGDPSQDQNVERLLRLGGGLADRLVATVVATWCERIETSNDRVADAAPQLRAALYGRLTSAVRAWTARHELLDVTLLPPGQPPVAGRGDGTVSIAVPFSWLRDVWCKGLVTTLGRLCLAAEPVGDNEWRLLTVAPDFAAVREMTITLG